MQASNEQRRSGSKKVRLHVDCAFIANRYADIQALSVPPPHACSSLLHMLQHMSDLTSYMIGDIQKVPFAMSTLANGVQIEHRSSIVNQYDLATSITNGGAPIDSSYQLLKCTAYFVHTIIM